MIHERTNNEILVRLPAYVDLTELQNMLDFLKYKDLQQSQKQNNRMLMSFQKIVNKSIWTKINK